MKCNIEKSDRINRIVFGIVILLLALVGVSKIVFVIIGLVLIIEGAIGWCGIPMAVSKLNHLIKKGKK